MEEAVIVRAKRTPIYKKNGRFCHLGVHELLSPLLRAVGGDVVSLIDDVIISNAVTPGGNVARLAALHAGFPETVPGITLDRQCSGGLDAVRFAAALIESGMGHCLLPELQKAPAQYQGRGQCSQRLKLAILTCLKLQRMWPAGIESQGKNRMRIGSDPMNGRGAAGNRAFLNDALFP